MDLHSPRLLSFAQAVQVTHTPDMLARSANGGAQPDSGGSIESSEHNRRLLKINCHVCHFRSRQWADIADHQYTAADGLQSSVRCSGADAYRRTYALTVQTRSAGHDDLQNPDFGDSEDAALQPVSPIHSRAGGLSASPADGPRAHDAHAGSPRPAQRHACSVPLAQWLARVYLSTDPQDISDLPEEGADMLSCDPDPDDSDPEDMALDTDQSAASSKMGY